MRYGQETWIEERRGPYILVGGLGAMGVGRMWMLEREDGSHAPVDYGEPFRPPTPEESEEHNTGTSAE